MPIGRIFVDTNVILEAFRTGCWTAICQTYAVETVEKCIEETLTGDPRDPRHIPVDRAVLIDGLAARHDTRERAIAQLVLSHPECQGLDDGELHLLALLDAERPPGILISTADKAAIVASARLGWIDYLVSLEHLAQQSGVMRGQVQRLARHYRADWLGEIKVKIRLGVIP